MKLISSTLKDKAQKAMSKLKANIKETYYNIAEIPSASVQQIAAFIQNHPDTQVEMKDLLGNQYYFFHLSANEDYFYLETCNDRILQLDVSSNGRILAAYRSYRDYKDLNTPIKLV